MKVFVYYNLHKKCWSVKALEGPNKGRVIKHTDKVYLKDVTFKVSQKGRERVLKEQRKNVHAGVVGHLSLADLGKVQEEYYTEITYNPYKYSSFVNKFTEKVVNSAPSAWLDNKRVWVQ